MPIFFSAREDLLPQRHRDTEEQRQEGNLKKVFIFSAPLCLCGDFGCGFARCNQTPQPMVFGVSFLSPTLGFLPDLALHEKTTPALNNP